VPGISRRCTYLIIIRITATLSRALHTRRCTCAIGRSLSAILKRACTRGSQRARRLPLSLSLALPFLLRKFHFSSSCRNAADIKSRPHRGIFTGGSIPTPRTIPFDSMPCHRSGVSVGRRNPLRALERDEIGRYIARAKATIPSATLGCLPLPSASGQVRGKSCGISYYRRRNFFASSSFPVPCHRTCARRANLARFGVRRTADRPSVIRHTSGTLVRARENVFHETFRNRFNRRIFVLLDSRVGSEDSRITLFSLRVASTISRPCYR